MEDLRQHDESSTRVLSALLPSANGAASAEERRWPPPSRPGGWGALPPDEAERGRAARAGQRRLRPLRQSPPAGGDRPPWSASWPSAEQCRRRSSAGLPAPAGRLRGAPDEVLAGLRTLLAEERLPDDAVVQVETCWRIWPPMAAARADHARRRLGRGLHFYTGIIFEIYDRRDGRDGGDACWPAVGATMTWRRCSARASGRRLAASPTAWSASSRRSRRAAWPRRRRHRPGRPRLRHQPGRGAYAIRVAQALRAEGRRVELTCAGAASALTWRRPTGAASLMSPSSARPSGATTPTSGATWRRRRRKCGSLKRV